jgi:hypothetical protein
MLRFILHEILFQPNSIFIDLFGILKEHTISWIEMESLGMYAEPHLNFILKEVFLSSILFMKTEPNE